MAYTYPFSKVDEKTKLAVWNKGRKIPNKVDPKIWRWDICGFIMKYSAHGDTKVKFGWEIDHIKPTEKGGSNSLSNLQPLYWRNNRTKGDTYPWDCP